jgi:hypothetical protein
MILFLSVATELKRRSLLTARLQLETIQRERAQRGNDDRVRDVYIQWCNVYDKEIDESRFHIFSSNFLYMEELAKESGKAIELNKWYDCTEEEYSIGFKAEAEEESARLAAEEKEYIEAAEEAERIKYVTEVARDREKKDAEEIEDTLDNSEDVMDFLPEEGFDARFDEDISNAIHETPGKDLNALVESLTDDVSLDDFSLSSKFDDGGENVEDLNNSAGGDEKHARNEFSATDAQNAASGAHSNFMPPPAFVADAKKVTRTLREVQKLTGDTTTDEDLNVSEKKQVDEKAPDGGLQWN